ncbi:MAG: phage major capsid protein [Pseudonocardiaceae bacterium]
MLEYLRQRLAALLAERAELAAARDAVLEAPTSEQRDLTPEEAAAFEGARTALIAHDEKINEARARIANLEEDEKRQLAADKIAADLGRGESRSPTRVQEPSTYARGNGRSYFRDIINAQVLGNRDAIERLITNDRELSDPNSRQRQEHQSRALTTVDGVAGEFVPPLWMIAEYIRLARAGRVIADQVRHMPLPGGTDTINLPRVATGTAVAEQATQNTAVQNTDASTNSIAANVATIAGQQVVSLQLLEQTPAGIPIDEILLADLAADYATKLDVFVISNNATNKVGLLSAAAAGNQITWTATGTMQLLYPKIADGIQRISTSRFLPPQKIFMHPRRWAWALSSLDSSGRPLVVPSAQMPQNALALDENGVVAEGFVGTLQGLPVFQDPSIPTAFPAAGQDPIIIARTDDIILFEGSPRSEAFREPLAAQLSVLLRFYNYAALHASRYPASIATITGTGLAAPTF